MLLGNVDLFYFVCVTSGEGLREVSLATVVVRCHAMLLLAVGSVT